MSDKITGAEALLQSLLAEGVDTVFGYPGGAILPVYDCLYDYADRLLHILVRHEQGAVHAAQGYARATGRVGVVIVTSGPGATNVITGLSDAMMDSTPLVVITGQVGAQYLGRDAFQETDVVAITQPITKWARQVRNADDIADAVARAFFIARTGRPGPVVIDIAKDAQIGHTVAGHSPVTFIRSYNPLPRTDRTSIIRAAGLLNRARRPLVLAGHGVIISGAELELAELTHKGNIPVAFTLLGLSAMPADDPLNVGMLGMHGNIGPNVGTNRADVILAVGMRFDDRVTGNTTLYAPNATIIHIDIDESEFDKTVPVDIAIHADARDALSQLASLINPSDRAEWLSCFDNCSKAEAEEVIRVELERPRGSEMTMGEVVRAVSDKSDGKLIAVTDVGQNQMMAARYCRLSQTRSFISSGGLGTMGFGLPAAIGAKIGCPSRVVCYFGGDGGFQMTIEELGTIMQYGIGVKIVLLNNNFLGNVRQWQQLFFHSRFSQTPMLNPDFVAIAAAYGIKGENVTSRDSLPATVDRLLADPDEPYLLNVAIDPTDMVFPMTPVGRAVDYIMLNSEKIFEYHE